MTTPTWQWDESIQRGTDYASVERVREYDERMAALRDVAAEAGKILALLALAPDDVVLDVGTGTGAFARAAAGRCRKVIALDVSPVTSGATSPSASPPRSRPRMGSARWCGAPRGRELK